MQQLSTRRDIRFAVARFDALLGAISGERDPQSGIAEQLVPCPASCSSERCEAVSRGDILLAKVALCVPKERGMCFV
jgi:hypothetical protein